MKIRMLRLLILGTLIVTTLLGCQESPLKLSVRYSALDNLKPDAPVFLDDTQIGQIEKIGSTDQGDYLVKIVIEPQYKQQISEHAHFYITSDPQQEQGQMLRVEVDEPGGTLLENGAIVQGEKKTLFAELINSLQKTGEQASQQLDATISDLKTALVESSKQFDQKLEESLDDLDRSLSDLGAKLQEKAPADDDLKQLEQLLDDFIVQFKQTNEEVKEQLREHVIPQLRQQLEELKKRMGDDEKKEEMKQLEVSLDELVSV